MLRNFSNQSRFYFTGSSIVYRRVVHPILSEREAYIDVRIANAKVAIYAIFVQLGKHAVKAASTTVAQSAIAIIPSSISDFALNALTEESSNRPLFRSQSADDVDIG